MSDNKQEKKQPESETLEEKVDAKVETEEKKPTKPAGDTPIVSEEAQEEESLDFSIEGADDELPEEIKQKLEKNKQARAKKKLVKKKKKKAGSKVVKSGRAYINATYNNTMVTLTDQNGDVISWASAGMAGFKGAKKATPYAAQIITKIAAQKAREEYSLEEVAVFVSGVGTGRESAIRALNANNLNVTSIKDTTPVPHNGCRPKKPRRV